MIKYLLDKLVSIEILDEKLETRFMYVEQVQEKWYKSHKSSGWYQQVGNEYLQIDIDLSTYYIKNQQVWKKSRLKLTFVNNQVQIIYFENNKSRDLWLKRNFDERIFIKTP